MEIKLGHIYSYTATYADGTVIKQDHTDENGDVSVTGNGSRFTDVLKKAEESKLISFVVHNDTFSFGVDLSDGHFEVNGIGFFQHRPDLDEYTDFRIIYYRTVRHDRNVETGEVASHIVGYGVGWQTNDADGKNVQKILFF